MYCECYHYHWVFGSILITKLSLLPSQAPTGIWTGTLFRNVIHGTRSTINFIAFRLTSLSDNIGKLDDVIVRNNRNHNNLVNKQNNVIHHLVC